MPPSVGERVAATDQVPLEIEGTPVEADVEMPVPPKPAATAVPCHTPVPMVPTVTRFASDVRVVFEEAVILAAVPDVFWFSVGTSAATIFRKAGAPIIPLGDARKRFAD